MGNAFQSQSATLESPTLLSSTDFVYDNILEIGATQLLEIPATSTLEIESYVDQPYINNALGTAPDANISFISQSAITENITLPISTNYITTQVLEIGVGYFLEIPPTSSLEIESYSDPGTPLSTLNFQNPVNFDVYRNNSLLSSAILANVIAFDTKNYDTGNNVDVTINQGRFYLSHSRVLPIHSPSG